VTNRVYGGPRCGRTPLSTAVYARSRQHADQEAGRGENRRTACKADRGSRKRQSNRVHHGTQRPPQKEAEGVKRERRRSG
jgi:hypothetical protein